MAESVDTGVRMNQLLTQAMSGDKQALGRLLDGYQGYLRAIAQRELGGKLNGREAASDLIQQTCISAWGKFSDFRGGGIPEFNAWLSEIHKRNLQDAARKHIVAARRSLKREQRLESGGAAQLPAKQDSPSGPAMAGEEAVALAGALRKLPSDQGEAIRLRYLERLSLAEICDRLGRSEGSVAGLLKRGLNALRTILSTGNPGTQ